MVRNENDIGALNALMIAYCDLIDAGDLRGCAALFSRGAWGIVGDMAIGESEVKTLLDNVILYDGKPNTRHLTSNLHIDIDSAGDSASARSCITVMQCVPGDFAMQAIFIGSYCDTFAKDEGGWYFVERAITPDLIGDMSRHRADMA
ncbi:nuclear transport factor 2 family protein [Luminiphilus sp.]|nr:nuclear transport factor 2 family protein [Luminiphilus sp.]|tara:strand:- start:1508 stop:1948 length:441 start_codon:yes stop_codon:yes gene_type:complete